MMQRIANRVALFARMVSQRAAASRLSRDEQGTVFVEYLLLLTIIGIGVIAGLATLRGALTSELIDLANAIASIS